MSGDGEKLGPTRLSAGSPDEREEAAYEAARSGSADRLQRVWDVLDDEPDVPGVRRGATDGLIDGAPESIPLILVELERHCEGPVAETCAYALGEIAYRQAAERDERIPAALVAALERLVDPDSGSASPYVAALRECARAKPVDVATPALKSLIGRIGVEADPYLFCLDNLLETLFVNDDGVFLDELEERLRSETGSTAFNQAAIQFLATHLPVRRID